MDNLAICKATIAVDICWEAVVASYCISFSESIFENSLYCRFSLKRFSRGILTKSTPKIAINFFSCVYIVLKCPPNINLIYPWYYKSSGPFCFFENCNMIGNQGTCESARIFHGKQIINIVTWHHNKRHSYFKLHLRVFRSSPWVR